MLYTEWKSSFQLKVCYANMASVDRIALSNDLQFSCISRDKTIFIYPLIVSPYNH